MPVVYNPCRNHLLIRLLFAICFLLLFLPFLFCIYRGGRLSYGFHSYRIKDRIDSVGRTPVAKSAELPQNGETNQGRSDIPSATSVPFVISNSQSSAVHQNDSVNHRKYTSLAEMVYLVSTKSYRFANYSLGVSEQDIETFQASLPPLLENYRSPCWLEYLGTEHVYDDSYYLTKDCMERDAVRKSFSWAYVAYKRRLATGLHWRVRCMPYFYLLGMPKSGTTDLYVAVIRYTKNIISGARKEPHFWNRRRFGIPYSGSCYNRPDIGVARLSDYLDLHDEAAEKTKMRYSQKDNIYYHKLLIGDFTPSTMWSLPQWWRIRGNENLDEPLYTTAHHLHGIWSRSQFIVMLRDPVERAFSQMKYRSLPIDGQVAAHFHYLVQNTIKELENCRPLRGCVYNRTDPLSPDMHGNFIIIPGMYSLFISDWLKVFPRQQFHFIRFEDYKRNKSGELDRLFTFLNTDSLDSRLRGRITKMPVANKGIRTESMWNKTRTILEDFYRPWNHRLADIVGDHSFRWGY